MREGRGITMERVRRKWVQKEREANDSRGNGSQLGRVEETQGGERERTEPRETLVEESPERGRKNLRRLQRENGRDGA